jgi:6-pyruvoyltetrahydropterin/6-carboxytetrahydropterin synthase
MGTVISKEIEFDAGHRVPSHDGKCRSPHGHRYKVRVFVTGEVIDEEGNPEDGMIKDFGFLKTLLTEYVHDPLDHAFIYHCDDRIMCSWFGEKKQFKSVKFPYVPTAENIARWCYEELKPHMKEVGARLTEICVWETPTSMAVYDG